MFTSVLTFVIAWSLIATEASHCHGGWIHFQSSCYGFGDEDVTWSGAETICQVFGSNLAEVETSEENEFLKGFARNRLYGSMWLGGTDVFSEGLWLWAGSKHPLNFTDWHAGEPNSIRGNEDYLMMYGVLNYQWNDLKCNIAAKFVCETRLPENIVG